MKKRCVILVGGLLCLSLALPVSAAGRQTKTPVKKTTGKVSKKKNGWHRASNGVSYYYIKGKIARSRFVKIGKRTYYFDRHGKAVKNRFVKIGKRTYYFDRHGKIAKKRFVKVGKKTYYFDGSGKIARSRFVRIEKKTCYFDSHGTLARNRWISYQGQKYRADSHGRIKKGGFIRVDGELYYMKENGVMQTGWKNFGEKKAYFGQDGALRTGEQSIDGAIYLFSDKGVLLTGEQQVGNATYQLSDSGKMEQKIVEDENGKTYYDARGNALSEVEKQKRETFETAKRIVQEITNDSMSQETKLQTCFNWVMRKPYVIRRNFSNFEGWPEVYANDHFLLGGGNCQSDAAAFGYMAKVLGYTDIYVCCDSDGTWGLTHSWTEIGGRVYDPLFAEAKGYDRYYNTDYAHYELHTIMKFEI